MKKISFIAAVLAFLFGISLYVTGILPKVNAAGNTGSDRWEYTFYRESQDPQAVSLEANRLGNEGWKLVMRDYAGTYWFKRRLP